VFYFLFIIAAIVCRMCLSLFIYGNDKKMGEASLPIAMAIMPHCRHPYLDVVVGLAWSNDPETYASSSIATDKVSMPDRSKVTTQTKRDTLVLQVGGWACS